MEQSRDNFKELLAFGEEGEKDVAIYLIGKGVSVLPLYQFTPESAPHILNISKTYTSPDLTCFKAGRSFFVEVKSKQRWVIDPTNHRTETGCDYRLYKQYLDLSLNLNIDLYIIFNHLNNIEFTHINESSNGFFMVNIKTSGRYWDGVNTKTNKKIHAPTYFWEYSQLKKITHD
jgi:hypothetical protein